MLESANELKIALLCGFDKTKLVFNGHA